MGQLPRAWATVRLRLRPFTRADVDDVFAYASDETWARFVPIESPYTRAHADWFVAQQIAADPGTSPRWALEQEGRVVGAVELTWDLQRHATRGLAVLHYAIAKTLWGQGLMTEAVGSVIDRAFEGVPELECIEAWADVRNAGSWRVMEKLGMTRVGLSRAARVVRGELVDDLRYRLLRSQWQAGAGQAGV